MRYFKTKIYPIAMALLAGTLFSSPVFAQSDFLNPVERGILEKTNAERAKKGLRPLRATKVLSRYAREWSQKMASGEVEFGHGQKGTPNSSKVRRRAAAAEMGRTYYGGSENVHQHSQRPDRDSAERAMQGWMNSEGHRDNILKPEQELIGIGVVRSPSGKVYATQIFLKGPR